MSLKNTKNLLIIAAVVVGVLAGTVLLGNYTNILSTSSDADSHLKACQAKASAGCPATKACSAENVEYGSVAKTCPLDSTKPCCAVEGIPGCCPKTNCPPDCTKPCCAGEEAPSCCPKTPCPDDCTKPCCAGEAKPTCCPKSDAAAAATGCCPATSTTN